MFAGVGMVVVVVKVIIAQFEEALRFNKTKLKRISTYSPSQLNTTVPPRYHGSIRTVSYQFLPSSHFSVLKSLYSVL